MAGLVPAIHVFLRSPTGRWKQCAFTRAALDTSPASPNSALPTDEPSMHAANASGWSRVGPMGLPFHATPHPRPTPSHPKGNETPARLPRPKGPPNTAAPRTRYPASVTPAREQIRTACCRPDLADTPDTSARRPPAARLADPRPTCRHSRPPPCATRPPRRGCSS
jgi:hypothetical protein